MKNLFSSIGVSDDELRDKDTAAFIYDFIEQQGGLEAVKKEIASRPAAPPPGEKNRFLSYIILNQVNLFQMFYGFI